MLSRIRREGQKLAVNGSGINGLQSLSFGYQSTAQPVIPLGVERVMYAPSSPQTASISANSLMVYDDFFAQFTGESPFSGQVNYKDQTIKFTEAYLSSYSCSCAIGEIPSLGMQAEIYGEMGTGNYFDFGETTPHDTDLQVAGYNSIDINLDEFSTNRVNSFALDIQVPRTPIYAFNDKAPSEVISNSPMDISLQFNIEADDYKIKNMRFVPEETVFRNVSLKINKNNYIWDDALSPFANNLRANIKVFHFKSLLLVSEQYQSDSNNNVGINFVLKGTTLR